MYQSYIGKLANDERIKSENPFKTKNVIRSPVTVQLLNCIIILTVEEIILYK